MWKESGTQIYFRVTQELGLSNLGPCKGLGIRLCMSFRSSKLFHKFVRYDCIMYLNAWDYLLAKILLGTSTISSSQLFRSRTFMTTCQKIRRSTTSGYTHVIGSAYIWCCDIYKCFWTAWGLYRFNMSSTGPKWVSLGCNRVLLSPKVL